MFPFRSSIKAIYFVSHIFAALGFGFIPSYSGKVSVILFSICPGIINSVYLVLPFILLSQIHQLPEIRSERGFGTDVSLLVSATFLSQVGR